MPHGQGIARCVFGMDMMDHQHQKIRLQESLKHIGVTDENVLAAINQVRREAFLPEELRPHAYVDSPLPIGEDQTISQPSLVAFMTQKLGIEKSHKVLEIGTGSGYQTALLAELAKEVFSIEVRETLSRSAQSKLKTLGYQNIQFKIGDGTLGWKEKSPFDRVIVTAAATEIPDALLKQLKISGRMIIPLKIDHEQELFLITKVDGIPSLEPLMAVRFVSIVSRDPKLSGNGKTKSRINSEFPFE